MTPYTIMTEIKDILSTMRKKRMRIRSVFVCLRKLNKFYGLSDLGLLNSIIDGLIDLNLNYSANEIYSAFKLVGKEDYDRETKHCLLDSLLKNAENKSIFKK